MKPMRELPLEARVQLQDYVITVLALRLLKALGGDAVHITPEELSSPEYIGQGIWAEVSEDRGLVVERCDPERGEARLWARAVDPEDPAWGRGN